MAQDCIYIGLSCTKKKETTLEDKSSPFYIDVVFRLYSSGLILTYIFYLHSENAT